MVDRESLPLRQSFNVFGNTKYSSPESQVFVAHVVGCWGFEHLSNDVRHLTLGTPAIAFAI